MHNSIEKPSSELKYLLCPAVNSTAGWRHAPVRYHLPKSRENFYSSASGLNNFISNVVSAFLSRKEYAASRDRQSCLFF